MMEDNKDEQKTMIPNFKVKTIYAFLSASFRKKL